MVSRRNLMIGAGPLAVGSPPPADLTLALPPPSGRWAVGRTTLHLVDTVRVDPWVPSLLRELMVSLWYPAAGAGRQRVRYMTAAESEAVVGSAALAQTRVDAWTDAQPAGVPRGLPLIVLSPGFTQPRATLSGLAVDLASHGYVVAAADHTYENAATAFPGGRVAACVACDVPDHDEAFWSKVDRARVDDVAFVIDELTSRRPRCRAATLIDSGRIGMAGHSAGGSAVLPAMAGDRRIRAGVDIDGGGRGAIPAASLDRPFLFLGRQSQLSVGVEAQAMAGAGARGEARAGVRGEGWGLLGVAGAVGESFADMGLLAGQLGINGGVELSGARSMAITRKFVRAFVDRHLRGVDAAWPVAPEVTVIVPPA